MRPPLVCRLPVLFTLAVFAAAASALDAEIQTLVAQDGRSIEAEILGYKDEVLRIRRTDTDKEYRLPLTGLDPAEQGRMRSFMTAHPELRETITADAIRVEFSRKGKSFPKVRAVDGSTRTSRTSFSITVTNRSPETVKNLRADYVIFVEEDPEKRATARREFRPLTQIRGSHEFETIDPSRGESFVTSEVTCTETTAFKTWTVETGGEIVRYTRPANEAGTWNDREIKGIRIRIYDGDRRVHQVASPDSLANE